MNQNDDERVQHEKQLKNAAGKPHLLVYAEKLTLLSGKTSVEGLIVLTNNLEKLQFALANHSDENELQGWIDFFTEALERHRKIKKGEKAEVISLNNIPKERGD